MNIESLYMFAFNEESVSKDVTFWAGSSNVSSLAVELSALSARNRGASATHGAAPEAVLGLTIRDPQGKSLADLPFEG